MGKGSKSKEEQSYELRDVVLAKIRGYPSWPAMIVDPETVPMNVLKERPGGKKSMFYCVRFFPAGDYSWVVSKDLSKLKKHEIEAYINEPHKKSGDLLDGYKIALNPESWEAEREKLRAEAEEAEANAEVDQLDGEEEADDADESEKPTKSKKRKRESEPGTKPKTPKPKKEKNVSETVLKKKEKTIGAKSKKNGTKSKAMVESEDEGDGDDGDAGPSKKGSPPPTKKAKKDEDEDSPLANDPEAQKVKEWRHRLQRGFLGKSLPKDEEVPVLDQLFTTVETYENLNIEYLQFSKIGKVMRHIANLTLEKVPRDDEFKFRDRAKVLVDKWHGVLNANKTNGAEPAPATNGTTKAATNGNGNAADSGTDEGTKKTLGEVVENLEKDLTITAAATADAVEAGDVTMSEA